MWPHEIVMLLDPEVDPLFEAVIDVVEEAVLNAICAGEATVGQGGHSVPGFPVDEIPRALRAFRAQVLQPKSGALARK